MAGYLYTTEIALRNRLTKEQYLERLETISGIPSCTIQPMIPEVAEVNLCGIYLKGRTVKNKGFSIRIDFEEKCFCLTCHNGEEERVLGISEFGESNLINLLGTFAEHEDVCVQGVVDVLEAVWQS